MLAKFKFGIVGVGPTGGIMAAHLAKAGHDPILIDICQSHMDEIKRNGLTITHLREFNAKFSQENIFCSINDLQDKDLNITSKPNEEIPNKKPKVTAEESIRVK